jgi:hypothetical protein
MAFNGLACCPQGPEFWPVSGSLGESSSPPMQLRALSRTATVLADKPHHLLFERDCEQVIGRLRESHCIAGKSCCSPRLFSAELVY